MLIEMAGAALGLLTGAASKWSVLRSGRALQRKFQQVGPLKGRSSAEIISLVGQPQAKSAIPGGGSLLQWMATGYHIALGFDAGGVCTGVTHEFSAR